MKSELTQITKNQYDRYKQGEDIPEITKLIKLILDRLPALLKKEAIKKGFILEEGNISMEILTLHVVVPKASNKLKHEIANEFIFCYLD